MHSDTAEESREANVGACRPKNGVAVSQTALLIAVFIWLFKDTNLLATSFVCVLPNSWYSEGDLQNTNLVGMGILD